MDQPRSSQRYEPEPRSDEPALVKRMLEVVRQRPRFGYRRVGRLLAAEGWRAGLGRVFRLWRREAYDYPQVPALSPSEMSPNLKSGRMET